MSQPALLKLCKDHDKAIFAKNWLLTVLMF